jgi:predicted amino acid racemase
MAELAERVDNLEDAVRRISEQIASQARLAQADIGELKADIAMIRAESLGNHATVVKELVGVRAELAVLRSDVGTLRQTVDALPAVIAQMFVEHNRRS